MKESAIERIPTPDGSPCRYCGEPISWDEICWIHNSTGFANCHFNIEKRTSYGKIVFNPEMHVDATKPRTNAVPVDKDWI
jgi:hypothetical protein